jgi:hypothetical protein
MKPRVASWSCKGLLFVEATVTALIIGAGLLFISRGLASSLKGLETATQHGTLVRLAASQLAELEAQAQLTQSILEDQWLCIEDPTQPGSCEYQWLVTMTEVPLANLPPQQGQEPFSQVAIHVKRNAQGSPTVQLVTLWPTEWIQP